ncbi:hypothetical protein BHE74_00045788 [Ensete ventricosum]|nr:hypothetical protein BHE74_00045788 [Ensete ventricosum]
MWVAVTDLVVYTVKNGKSKKHRKDAAVKFYVEEQQFDEEFSVVCQRLKEEFGENPLQLWKLLGRLDEDDGWLWKGSEAPRYTALIPSVRTLADSKLGVDLYRGSSSWNTIGVPSSKVFGYKS